MAASGETPQAPQRSNSQSLDLSSIRYSNRSSSGILNQGESPLMRFLVKTFGLPLGVLALSTLSSFAAAKPQSFTGTVSDAMCGAKHMMEGDPAACLRACVQKGSKYALVVGEKVYTLDTQDKSTLATLDKLANQKATVKGQANGDDIEVSSVSAAK